MSASPAPLPEDFLSRPAQDIILSRVDFAKVGMPEYKDLYAVVLDNVLTAAECQILIAAAEATSANGWERAKIMGGSGRQYLATDTRNCGRIIWDSSEVTGRIWTRVEAALGDEAEKMMRLENVAKITGNGPAMRGETWRFTRLNERMRFLKYERGEYFRPHLDGTYETPDGKEMSMFTLHLYLNSSLPDADANPITNSERQRSGKSELIGRATTFHSRDMETRFDVMPKAGRVLLFQHRGLPHSGDNVTQGVKFSMRTDLMFELSSRKVRWREAGIEWFRRASGM
ncbi:hypothetical protein LTR66_010826 [Elasticomyces elasticus]|nr:hypothetical protein LTR66_010826 [Elasticomyces elasticus]